MSSVEAFCFVIVGKTDEDDSGFASLCKLNSLSNVSIVFLCFLLLEFITLSEFNIVADLLKLFKSVVKLSGVDV